MSVLTLPEWQIKSLARAADEVANELGEAGPDFIPASLSDVSVSYARGVGDVLEMLIGNESMPCELRVIYDRYLDSV